jgi:hypothetical protein
MSNKFKFIQTLLENEKFDSNQKERFLKLISIELEKSSEVDTQFLEYIGEIDKVKKNFDDSNLKIEKIDEEINGIKNEIDSIKKNEITQKKRNEDIYAEIPQLKKQKKESEKKEKKFIPDPNPKHVADFMSLFNKRLGLKYLTHDYDENNEFIIDKFLVAANDVFHKETKKLNIPQSLWAIVKQFAFDSKQTSWTSISNDYQNDIPIKIGWATPELRDWSKQNNLHPFRNEDYKKIINSFKRITRIERSNLDKLIDAALKSALGNEIDDFKLNKTDISKADFYSHVSYLKIALVIIFKEIKKHSAYSLKKEITREKSIYVFFKNLIEKIKKRSNDNLKKEITIKYERSISDDDYYLRKIIITHHKSFPSKELKVLLKEWQEKGNMGRIKEKLKGYCHWSVETMVENSPTRINILKEKDTPVHEIIESKTEMAKEGFTHILTFYYK